MHTGVAERDSGRLAVKDLLHVLVDVDAAGVAECDHLQHGSCVSPEYSTSFPFSPSRRREKGKRILDLSDSKKNIPFLPVTYTIIINSHESTKPTKGPMENSPKDRLGINPRLLLLRWIKIHIVASTNKLQVQLRLKALHGHDGAGV